MERENTAVNPSVIELRSLTKGKRMLLHLADLFVNFFIAMFLFSVVVFPLGKLISGYDQITASANEKKNQLVSILKENQLLDAEKSGDDFTTALTYSAKLFTIGFLTDNPRYDYPRTYFVSLLKKSESELVSIYQKCDSVGFFDYDSSISLKERYRSEFAPVMDEKDSFSALGEEDYTKFSNLFFPSIYSLVIEDLEENSSLPNDSLKNYQIVRQGIDQDIEKQNLITFVCGLIGYVLSCAFYFLLFPMINKRGRTLSMVAIKIERVGKNNLRILRRRERWLGFIFYMAFHMALAIFLPMMFVDFSSLFSIVGLLTMSIIGLVLDIVSFFFVFFSQYHQGLSDLLTNTVYITSADYEKVQALKTFKVAK